ncbi:dienelactone hydrolase family protein [Polaromonas sp. P5_D5]
MRSVISFLLVLGFVSSFGFSPNADAVEFVEPTPEQKARCEAVADERPRQLCLQAYSVMGLKFPDTVEEFGSFTNASRMAIFKPKGNGPFPALLLLHTCAAVDFDPQHMRYWVSRALEEGYVAFVVDSWKQRGIPQEGTCFVIRPGFAPLPVRVRDAYEALRHLGKFDFVDTSRVAAMGFSQGGRVAHLLASKGTAARYSVQRFAATVAVYGQCFSREFGATFVLPDSDAPLLSLLGELDEDGDPRECLPRLQKLQESGAPVEWHVFPNTGHAWDQPKSSPPRRVRQIGSSPEGVLFAYDAKVADESRKRVFEFLARHLKARDGGVGPPK